MNVALDVDVDVVAPLSVAALVNGNHAVAVINAVNEARDRLLTRSVDLSNRGDG